MLLCWRETGFDTGAEVGADAGAGAGMLLASSGWSGCCAGSSAPAPALLAVSRSSGAVDPGGTVQQQRV